MSKINTASKEVEHVKVYCRNPMMSFSFDFASLSEAEENISERLRWGELEGVVVFYKDGTQDVEEFDAWGS